MNNYLRNGGMFSESEYKGKSLQEATKYAEDGGFIVRVVENNGQSFMVDALDIKANRINFRVRNDVVTGAFGG